jgi:enoyl-CoA hydratase/carnithine racemase
MSDGSLDYEKDGHVGRITFNRPQALNALTAQMWSDLGKVAKEIAQDRSVRVVTLRGAGGKAFLSGTDIGGFLKFESGKDGLAYEARMDEYVGAVEAIPQPVIAVIEGYAVGGGLALSCAADFRIATPSAKFGSPLGRTIGNCLSAKSYARAVGHVGVAQAKRMLILGEMIPAGEMLSLGLLNAIAEPGDLDAVVQAMCDKLAAQAPLTLRANKEAIRRLTYRALPDMSDLVEMIYGSNDFHMGVRNFMDKKKPEWTGT